MEKSSNLGMPYLAPAQALKSVTHNAALRHLDRLVQLSIISAQSSPPQDWQSGVVEDESRFIVMAPAQQAWAGHDGDIAVLSGGVWEFLKPQTGWVCWNIEDEHIWIYEADVWKPLGISKVETFGINTSPDALNRLSVRSDASLFDTETGSHRLTINRASDAETASVVFQSGYQGRAELGLTGVDGFTLKLSDNGSEFQKVLEANSSTGDINIQNDLSVEGRIRQDGQPVLDNLNTFGPLADRGDLPADRNLDDQKSSGYWAQTQIGGADLALNYPVEERGVLLVIRAWVMVFQTYYVIAHASNGESANIYTRALFGTSWTPWRLMN